jgi:hypothetical protein
LATAGDGGSTSFGTNNGGGAGGAVTLVNAASGATNGGTLILSQTAVGGKGGDGDASSGVGSSASSTLTLNDTLNPTQSAVLTGTVNATGGAGGHSIAGFSTGAGGNATAALALTGTGQVGATGLATGGQGGGTVAGLGGNGGTANANVTANSTGPGSSSAIATALGGLGAAGFVSGGTGGSATANASATGNGPSTAAATAIGGNGGAAASKGIAQATAVANTINGQQATAHATGAGNGGLVSTSTETSGSVITSLRSAATGPTDGTVNAESRANVARNVSDLDQSGLTAYAFGTGLPGGAFVNGALSTHPNIGSAFSASGALVLGTGAEGAYFANDGTTANTFESDLTFDLNTTSLSGDLLVGLLDNLTFGSGFDRLEFRIIKQGATVLDDVFTNASAAQGFFDDHILNLGTFSNIQPLDLEFSLVLTASSPGQGFGEDLLFGAVSSVVPPPPGGAPEPNILALFALALVLLMARGWNTVFTPGRRR